MKIYNLKGGPVFGGLTNKGALNKTGQLKHTHYYLNIEHDSAIST